MEKVISNRIFIAAEFIIVRNWGPYKEAQIGICLSKL